MGWATGYKRVGLQIVVTSVVVSIRKATAIVSGGLAFRPAGPWPVGPSQNHAKRAPFLLKRGPFRRNTFECFRVCKY